jgi:hypothetical protein
MDTLWINHLNQLKNMSVTSHLAFFGCVCEHIRSKMLDLINNLRICKESALDTKLVNSNRCYLFPEYKLFYLY